MDFSTILIIAIIVGVFIGIGQIVATSQKKKDIEARLAELGDFESSQKVVGEDGETGIALDEQRKKVCLIKHNAGNVDLTVISYRDLLASEIYEDGMSITKTSRVSQAGTALVGGLLFGGVGAMVGGLTGKKSTSDKIKRIDLRLTVNRTQAPIHDVNFMNAEGKKGGLIYNAAMPKARHWHGLIEVLIRRADEDDRKEENRPSVTIAEKHSVADELLKLAKLKEQGVLTDTEFAEQKAQLLSNG